MKSNSNYLFFKNGILILLLLLSSMSFAQAKVEQIEELLSTYEEYGKFNGSVLVSDQGKVIYKKGFGMANMEWDIPNQPNTKHRLGSITKQFTAMLILQLVEEGKLDLKAPITTYLPDYPKASGDIITTHHLLTHTSGIPNYTAFPKFMEDESRNPYTPEEFVKTFSDKALDFTPGEKFSYSNSGYFLLGVLIEKLAGKSYEQMLQDKIFIPLSMKDSGYDNHGDILKNRATGYEKQGGDYVNSSYLDMSIPYAAGSIYSTVEDLYKWDQALYTTSILPKEYMTMYFKPHIPGFDNLHYAYGWIVGYAKIGKSTDSIYAMGHGGGINGFNTNISRTTSNNSLVVLLNNTGRAPLNDMTKAILGIMHGKEYDMPKKSVADAVLAVIEAKGIEAGLSHYNSIKESENYSLSENEMNTIGYQLMESDKVEEANKVFQLIIKEFPTSSNAYDSFGESLMKLGKNDLAIKNYRKSVALNPNNQNGIDSLKNLGDDVSDLVKEVKVSNAVLETYIGKYELQPGFILSVTREGNQLKTQATGQLVFDIFPKSENEFYLKVVDAQLVFNKNDAGDIDSVTLFQGGREMIGKRKD
ncbi:beta-lactamase family protein with a TPR domain containing C-terminal region [Psychroflexus torquis ATCC 700755]|uniref:Beta-lactamase family protein with a TPR domain containing C-terminal region n=1 Tax=Psychroflexus torquis (strain ATCC 700755 / CIP 106069 / ACAM 623) TaxID=313595 RepID=K4IAS6_PSYTT|nr:serine hydrolase [Psychroflexus torquis]AFU67727.1 beta-lactamase family protein with a TPR domain containing C-terminal region [Psychroflexus torquis ATCC 700755]